MSDVHSVNVLDRRRRAAVEFVSWSDHHAHERRRREAGLAQIETHPDALDQRNAIAQQRAWSRRQDHCRHLHDSALAQLRHR
ncbi:hypothetical protein [Synechococcus sp. BS55D]|uniref:hypothetical protein n=1 Tax=Synechococcus sp. BS55D TaxID=2055943 RepID=UPI00103F7B1D|nr:hypothetical protein [Synechococcus sp. BS55D]TCD57104.1 hypothetical protein CWE16_04765 [Synechococcus sp. BS55D]